MSEGLYSDRLLAAILALSGAAFANSEFDRLSPSLFSAGMALPIAFVGAFALAPWLRRVGSGAVMLAGIGLALSPGPYLLGFPIILAGALLLGLSPDHADRRRSPPRRRRGLLGPRRKGARSPSRS